MKAYPRRLEEGALGIFLIPPAVAIAVALLGGFPLGLLASVAKAQGWELGTRTTALTQAHGHAQLVGWAGLFIVGLASRLVPRFAGAPSIGRIPFVAAVTALSMGLGVRVVAQPLVGGGIGHMVMVAASALEAVGVTVWVWHLFPSLRRPLARGAPFAPYLTAMAFWLVTASCLQVFWWGLHGVVGGVPLLPFPLDQALAGALLMGFVVNTIVGVGLRTVFVFFGRPIPSSRMVWSMWVPLQAGIALYVLALAWTWHQPGDGWQRVEAAGHTLMGMGIVVPALLSGFWRPPVRLQARSREPGLLVKMGMAWLAGAGGLSAVIGAMGLVGDSWVPLAKVDVVRHILGVGVITTMILGMAFLILPPFALARQGKLPYRREVRLSLVALPLATLLRAVGGWVAGQGPWASHLMAWSGALTWVVVAAFALAFVQAIQHARRGMATQRSHAL